MFSALKQAVCITVSGIALLEMKFYPSDISRVLVCSHILRPLSDISRIIVRSHILTPHTYWHSQNDFVKKIF